MLIQSGQRLFLPNTVTLELEWVLRGYNGFAATQVLAVFDPDLFTPNVQLTSSTPSERRSNGWWR
jgi:hypothetical protein